MRKVLGLAIAASVFMLALVPEASALDARNNFGGVYDESEYQEVVFITGKPVVLTGEISTSEGRARGRDSGDTASVSYQLENEDEGIRLTRNVTYTTEQREKGNQILKSVSINSLSENITTPLGRFNLSDYQYSKSLIQDDKPGVDYFTGEWNSRKIYDFNGNDGKVIVYTQGETVGYESPWGTTETQKITGSIDFSGEVRIADYTEEDNWHGTYEVSATYNLAKDLRYRENEPQFISFSGGYIVVEDTNQYMNYSCRMPVMDRDGISKSGRDTYSGSLNTQSLATYQRLPVKNLNDMNGHWAEGAAKKLYSLEVFDGGNYFGPNVPMTRGEFAYALARIIELTEPEEETEDAGGRQFDWGSLWGGGGDEEEDGQSDLPMFFDVPESHKYYDEIKAVSDANLVMGTGNGHFSPDDGLTRAQAITAFIRALGFEHLSPKGVSEIFADDAAIPSWAREYVYVAAEIGLVTGDAYGFVTPNQVMTRAEAAALLERFMGYLQEDLRHEYRDKIINFY